MELNFPQHIAIIMDGNGRWAKKRLMPRVFGHQFALKRVKEIVQYLGEKGVGALTLYAFSTENWQRPEAEVSFLMNLVLKTLKNELQELHANQICFRTLGDCGALPLPVQKILQEAEELMMNNTGLSLNIALNYGGRAEIITAVKAVITAIELGEMNINDLNELKFNEFLYTKNLPSLDLMIRTGGEQRMSNFLLWQCAYAELYFTDILFPDFNLAHFEKALEWFKTRERRHGKISEQIRE